MVLSELFYTMAINLSERKSITCMETTSLHRDRLQLYQAPLSATLDDALLCNRHL